MQICRSTGHSTATTRKDIMLTAEDIVHTSSEVEQTGLGPAAAHGGSHAVEDLYNTAFVSCTSTVQLIDLLSGAAT